LMKGAPELSTRRLAVVSWFGMAEPQIAWAGNR
jgi:hypothetical protein